MLQKCDHLHLFAEDVERTVLWYCRVLGAKVTFEGQYRGSKVRYLDIAGMNFIVVGRFDGETPGGPFPSPRYGLDHFGFAVDDLDRTLAGLVAAGAKVLEGPVTVRPGLRIAYIEAPDSGRIELSERKA